VTAPENEVSRFFERSHSGGDYRDLKTLTRAQDELAASVLNAGLRGRALTIGGVWEGFSAGPAVKELSALDLSAEMLKSYAPEGARQIVGDVFETDLPEASFDSIVFSLMLHHVAEGGWARCEERVRTAIARAARWLAPGGTLFVLEYCPHPAWMPLQRLGLPLTKAFLALAGQPLVVMHPTAFYEKALGEAGLRSFVDRPIRPENVSPWTWFPVFMAVKWLKLPLGVYPKMHIFSAEKDKR
jgi:SAM-dependent methyltransferase